MDTATRPADSALEEQLFARGERFAYFQAIRLLRRRARARQESVDDIRVRPRLALGFPETDIDRIERRSRPIAPPLPGGRGGVTPQADDTQSDVASQTTEVVQLTANFFGLYGVATPLPSFYTEDLLEEHREGRKSAREFLDILHYTLYPLLFDSWVKYRPHIRIVEEGDTRMLDHLHAFVGLDDASIVPRDQPGVDDLLRYTALLAQRPRSALGLQTLLSDAFSPARVEVVSCIESWLPIPDDQCMRLGQQAHALGVDAYLGSQASDWTSQLRVEFHDLSDTLFRALQPGNHDYDRLRFLVRFYVLEPHRIDIRLALRPGAVLAARTGGERWNRLGQTTWLAPRFDQQPEPVTFTL
jgi:type VI secretion system protein ImpH